MITLQKRPSTSDIQSQFVPTIETNNKNWPQEETLLLLFEASFCALKEQLFCCNLFIIYLFIGSITVIIKDFSSCVDAHIFPLWAVTIAEAMERPSP